MAYDRKTWKFRDDITEDELNRMEDGIEEGITKAEQAEQTAQQAAQTASQTANELAAHLADNTIHKTSDVIRTETETKLKVEVVSSSGSETPEQGRIIFDTSQGKFFGGNGSGWV